MGNPWPNKDDVVDGKQHQTRHILFDNGILPVGHARSRLYISISASIFIPFPVTNIQDLAHALRTRLAKHGCFQAPKRQPNAFAVEHYAGEVVYASEGLLDKNRDFVVAEHAALAAESGSVLLRELFVEEPDGTAATGRRSAFQLSTVGSRFRKQLGGLMGTLGSCQPHYIRCIKPNPASVPGTLGAEYVLEQLRAGGVLEAVRIACAGA